MSIAAPWNDRLAEPLAGEHLVQVYRDDRVLVGAVALYACGGLAKGEAVVLVATAAHLDAIRSQLIAAGFEVDDLVSWGQLTMIEAERLLSRLLGGGGIDPERFRSTLGAIVSNARAGGRYRRVRVYGEMVDLLWRHDHPATRRLEELWNEGIEAHSLALLCGYGVREDGGLDRELPPDLRALHSHLIPLEAGSL